VIVPHTGHTINLEEPAKFNAALEDFLTAVEHARWPARDAGPGYVLLPPGQR
jgi:proline iminopeptidase